MTYTDLSLRNDGTQRTSRHLRKALAIKVRHGYHQDRSCKFSRATTKAFFIRHRLRAVRRVSTGKAISQHATSRARKLLLRLMAPSPPPLAISRPLLATVPCMEPVVVLCHSCARRSATRDNDCSTSFSVRVGERGRQIEYDARGGEAGGYSRAPPCLCCVSGREPAMSYGTCCRRVWA